eukprot:TRINITY_DN1362_c0_g1_i3.p2 TRINITY_DN1362_c0_g1~~TRINITY_DN1362_c0_g1_i3.p2  ORF type:complete len:149 (-),score=61.51 TRINITY_DN1362_c0_g1_i3:111-557(-)
MSDSDMDSDEREALAAFKAEGFDKKLELEEKARHAKTEQEAERAATAREERERKAEEERQRERVLEQKKRPRILVNPRVFMEVSVTGKLKGASGMAPCEPEMLGRIVFELYINQTPRTCLLYTSDAADEEDSVDLGGRRIIKKKKKSQ